MWFYIWQSKFDIRDTSMPVELVLIKYNLMSNKIDHKHMGQGIQEWTKKNLCKTAFKKI